ncbi:hypothetical protein [Sphingomonas sp.]|uniref:hypothetical protein n=1 Tax=Sphingomonas sp. TaxID=28214 RepID=UPI00286D81E9|nr:hypothetical protein [Sphingomonas sp.]
MANANELPEGTDKIIAGASETGTDANGGAIGANVEIDNLVVTDGGPEGTRTTGGTRNRSGTRTKVLDTVRCGTDKLSGQAADKARGLVAQGLERSSEALANVSKLVGDTATGLDDRLGAEYGDYARRAAGAIEDAANNLAAKNADELIDDTRNLVRKSPGVALAGAAIVGFALARLVKSGLDASRDSDDGGTSGGKRGGGKSKA